MILKIPGILFRRRVLSGLLDELSFASVTPWYDNIPFGNADALSTGVCCTSLYHTVPSRVRDLPKACGHPAGGLTSACDPGSFRGVEEPPACLPLCESIY